MTLDDTRKRVKVLGVEFDRLTLAQTAQRIREAAATGERLWLSTANVNWVVTAGRDADFADTLRDSQLCVADGQPLVWLARWLGAPLPERVAGADLFEALSRRAPEREPLRVYFFGGPPGAARRAARALNERGGALQCVGHDAGGYGDVKALSDEATIARINAARPHFLVVALGAQKGQRWIAHNRDRLQVPVVSHLGAVVNFAAGDLDRAPRWMRRAGLEWAWRIKEEPVLLRRYAADAWGLLRLLWRHHGAAAARAPQ
jgi:N-acetylglucosaminyldiphosphoundecaprenol N-acetyl-beta-D-mannosaminyltransferase